MKSTLLRIFAAMMALVMMVCCFTACGDNTKDPEITKPSDVEGPNGDDDLVDFDGVDENGNPTTCKFSCVDDMGENVADWVYEYTKFDDKGTWIDRKKTVTKDSYTSWETQEVAVSTPNVTHVETREITYF